MQRYFISQPIVENQQELPNEIYHNVKNVMRQKVGGQFELADGKSAFVATIVSLNETLIVTLDHKISEEKEMPVHFTIACGFPKGEKLEFIAQKVTELGAAALIAYPSATSVVKWNEQKLQKKAERLKKIMQEASEQAHRTVVPAVTLFKSANEFLDIFSTFDFILVAYEEEAKRGEKSQLVKSLQQMPKDSQVLVIFGPEGGFTPAEIENFLSLGAESMALGPRIMRAETAPMYVLSAASFAFELGGLL
ncbi:16S rRNA (uracil(1498)-N(3))-methyltransferase [Enterococcus timonensis]|uniref:16S rRNA (uracil(1498)-N(3))-methyltransferase n=1 Tax=Enterococcus timonensis TaxID=1852364 RepID=UPI0008D954A6|nr:16S rRNA (uracil(1498)-N(3))-methyltransferase [Enterococcus timonensis]